MTPMPDQGEVQSLVIPQQGWIRDYVNLYRDSLESPPEAIAGMAYALLASAVGWKAYLQWADSREPLSLFVVLVGGSASAHKTTVLKIGSRIASDAQREYRRIAGSLDDDEPFIKIVSGGHTSSAGLLQKIAPADQDQAERWDLLPPPGILLEWDELGDLVVDRDGGSFLADTRQMLLRLYNGHQPGSNTISNPVPPSRCAVSMIGTITTEDWTERMSPEAVTGGLMGRLFAIPTGKVTRYIPRPVPINQDDRRRIVEWLGALGAVPGMNEIGPVVLDRHAAGFWDDWYLRSKRDIDKAEAIDPIFARATGALFNRYQAIALKVAGLQQISLWNPGDGMPSAHISEPVIRNACSYIDLALSQASIIATELIENADERFFRRIEERLKNGPMTIRELQQRVRIRGVNATTWHRWLDVAEYIGLCEKFAVEKNGRSVIHVRLPGRTA